MKCGNCGGSNCFVVDSRAIHDGIRRRRECSACGPRLRFTTYEISEHDYGILSRKRKYDRERKKTPEMRCVERNRRKASPSPRDLLRDKYPRRYAEAISSGRMTEEQVKMEIGYEAVQRLSSTDTK